MCVCVCVCVCVRACVIFPTSFKDIETLLALESCSRYSFYPQRQL